MPCTVIFLPPRPFPPGSPRAHQVEVAGLVPQVPRKPQEGVSHEFRYPPPSPAGVRDEASVTDMRAPPGKVGLDVKHSPHVHLLRLLQCTCLIPTAAAAAAAATASGIYCCYHRCRRPTVPPIREATLLFPVAT